MQYQRETRERQRYNNNEEYFTLSGVKRAVNCNQSLTSTTNCQNITSFPLVLVKIELITYRSRYMR